MILLILVLLKMLNLLNQLFPRVICPYRIVVLHETGTLGPSGRLGSIPGVGVCYIGLIDIIIKKVGYLELYG